MPGSIQNLEIMSAGVHNASTGKITVTEADLDEMVANFTALQGSNIVKPHLKLGHTDAQKWFGQSKGVPTLGWVDRVWRRGTKLLADIRDVPEALLELIRAGRYHNVSSEAYSPDAGIEKDGKKFGWVLSAVALLGVEMPAVKDLAGLAAALFTDQPAKDGVQTKPVIFSEERTALFTQEQVDALIAAAVLKATDPLKATHKTALDDVTAQLTVMTARATTAEGSIKKLQEDTAKADAVRIVDDAIKAGKLLPKQKDFALAFMGMAGTVKFGDGEKSPAKLFQEFLDTAGKQITLDEKGAGKNAQRTEFASAAEEVDYRVKKLQAEDPAKKLTYTDGLASVLAADEELKTRYSAGE